MIYFDNSATGRFLPPSVIKAVIRELNNPSNAGRSGHSDAIKACINIRSAREQVKRLIKNDNAEIALTKNCTEALNLAILGTLKPGRHVITTAMEHNSVLRPLFELKRKNMISLTVVQPTDNGVTAEELAKAVNKDTYLLAVTAVSNVNGLPNNLKECGKVAENYGLLYLVDGAQSLGKIPFNMRETGCDMVAAPGHKCLHGVQGSGFLAFSRSVQIKPLICGGTGTESNNLYQPLNTPESLESGTLNTPAFAALAEGIGWTIDNFDSINIKISKLALHLLGFIKNEKKLHCYTDNTLGIIAFSVDGYSSAEVADILNENYNIAVRSGLHCAPLMHKHLGTENDGLVRVSLGYNNTFSEVEKLIKALKTLIANK